MLKHLLPSLRKRSEEALRPVSIAELMEDFWRSPFTASPWPEEFRKGVFGMGGAFPKVNVSETEKEIAVEAELPGLAPEDVEVRLEDQALVITGEKKFEGEEKKDTYHRLERSYGSFTRVVPLPCRVSGEGVAARFEKGVLRVTLPKAEPAEPAKRITIEG